jgi:succinate-acetate transporter protein
MARTVGYEHWTKAGPIVSATPDDQLAQLELRAAATVGESAPLGLLGFATATFTVGTILAGWYPQKTVLLTIPILLIFGGIVQFIAAMWSYRKGDTFGATAFGSFGAFNTTFALFLILQQGMLHSATTGIANLGIWIGAFSFIALFLSIAALGRNLALVGVLFFLFLTYGFIATGYLTGQAATGGWLMHLGGWAGIISSVLAFYTAAVMVINSNFGRNVFPLWSRE